MKRIALGILMVAAAAMLLSAAAPAWALDRIHLKNGKVVEGEITREGDGFVFIDVKTGSLVRSEIITLDQVARIERDVDAVAASTTTTLVEKPASDPTTPAEKPDASPARPGPVPAPSAAGNRASRVCFISLEDMVGTHLNADALKRSADIAREEKADIVVLVIDSGGGYLAEVMPLSDVIHKEMKKDFRVVAWIRSAISAASMTAWNCEEIYMMPQGHIGGTVAFSSSGSGQNKALEGVDLERVLMVGEELSRRGKRNPLIMRAMQLFMDLSADIDENGNVSWREGRGGQFLVNPKENILTLNSQDALKYKVSRGTAATKEELLRLMGVAEWVEVAPKADEYQREFRANVSRFSAEAERIMGEYQLAMAAANGAGGDEKLRNMYLGRARSKLLELQSAVRKAPSYEKYSRFNKEWFEEQFEELRKRTRDRR